MRKKPERGEVRAGSRLPPLPENSSVTACKTLVKKKKKQKSPEHSSPLHEDRATLFPISNQQARRKAITGQFPPAKSINAQVYPGKSQPESSSASKGCGKGLHMADRSPRYPVTSQLRKATVAFPFLRLF